MDMHRYWNDPAHATCPAIAAFLETWCESMPDDQGRHWLQPLEGVVRDTWSGAGVQTARRIQALDWLVREYAPLWLEADGRPQLAEHATALRGLRAPSLKGAPFAASTRSQMRTISAACSVLPDAYFDRVSRVTDSTQLAVASEQASVLGVAASQAIKSTAAGDSAGSAAVAAIATDPALAEDWNPVTSEVLSIATSTMHGRILLAVHEGLTPRVDAVVVPALERAGVDFSQARSQAQFEKTWRKVRRIAEQAVDGDEALYDEAWRTGWDAIGGTVEAAQSSAFELLVRMVEQR